MVQQFDPAQIRQQFPLLIAQEASGSFAYLDNGATTQKPAVVINRVNQFYSTENANVHRGLYPLSEQATLEMENARKLVQHFINAKQAHEIIFTKGTTDAINLIASSFSQLMLKPCDEILITHMEHHANIIPWQLACERYGAVLKVLPVTDNGELALDALDELLTTKTKLLGITHISNVLGTINPVKSIIERCHQRDIPVLVDGAQAVAHTAVDVQSLDCDFYVFSGHKLFAPTGVGVLYGKSEWLEKLPPYQGGGDMIDKVSFEKTTYAGLPYKFEAGTPAIAQIIGLGSAIQFLQQYDFHDIHTHTTQLRKIVDQHLSRDPDTQILGQATNKIGTVSFYSPKAHPQDLATLLSFENVAVRSGHHCAMPLMNRFSVPATLRASFAMYNTVNDAELFCEALDRVKKAL